MKPGHHAKLQHYVPQFLLRNFCCGKKKQVWIFDKQTGRKFRSHPRNVASESKFNDFTLDGVKYTIEPWLSNLESQASKIVTDIIRAESLAVLNDTDKQFLSYFMAIQFVRTKQQSVKLKQFSDAVVDLVRATGGNPDQIKGIAQLDEEDLGRFRASSVAKASEYVPYFYRKTWLVLRTSKNCPLYISDNPITLDNRLDHRPFGSYGLAVEGIQVYMPLSRALCLALYCPTIELQIRDAGMVYSRFSKISPDLMARDGKLGRLNELIQGMDSGRPVQLSPENVLRLNSLQVAQSFRFVFSTSTDFSLAERMIEHDASYKEAPKTVIGFDSSAVGSDDLIG